MRAMKKLQNYLIGISDTILTPVPSSLTFHLPKLYDRLVRANYNYAIWKTRHSIQGTSFYTHHLLDLISYENEKFGEDSILACILEESEKGDTLYDMGANCGIYTLCFLSEISESEVVAFEPNPEVFERLCTNVELNGMLNRFEGINMALFDENCTKQLQVAENPYYFSGDYAFSTIMGSDFEEKKYIQEIDSYKCEARRLDSLFSEKGLSPPDRIKIDIQGAGLRAIKGSIKTLREYRPTIYYEIHKDEDGELHIEELEELFEELDYNLERRGPFMVMRP